MNRGNNMSKDKINRILGLAATLALFLGLMAACQAQPAAPPPTISGSAPEGTVGQDAPPTPELDTIEIESGQQVSPDDLELLPQNECPGLDSWLFQLTQVPKPLELAEQLGFRVKADKIQVLLVLASEDTSFLQTFPVEPGTQSGTELQAFVPVDQLCDLANAAEVLAIRLPAQAVPQQ